MRRIAVATVASTLVLWVASAGAAPPGKEVVVSNDASAPVPVVVQNLPATRSPVMIHLNAFESGTPGRFLVVEAGVSCVGSVPACSPVSGPGYVVPGGHVLEIGFVGLNASMAGSNAPPAAQLLSAALIVGNLDSPQDPWDVELGRAERTETHPAQNYEEWNQSYVAPIALPSGSVVGVLLSWDAAGPGGTTGDVVISGQLVEQP